MMVDDGDILLLSNNSQFTMHHESEHSALSIHNASTHSNDSCIDLYVAAYRVGEVLGSGGFGEVRIGTNRFSGQKVALKFVRKKDIVSVDMANRVSMEIQSLMTLSHPNIRKLHTVSAVPYRTSSDLSEASDLL
jgi:serine/threonine protein kinase